jgi:predicted esterase
MEPMDEGADAGFGLSSKRNYYMPPTGQLLYFRSSVDGQLYPCAVCATDDGSEPKALIIEVSPGAYDNLPGAVALTEEIAGIAARQNRSCVVLRPTGRGGGSVYQNYGEVDVLEAIEHVAGLYPIDRDRISITGSSMGGAAVWYLISHYPDLFAGAAPFCGYCDYRLWEKPGGLTFHMHPWEEPSWQARSAALLVENMRHTPVWMVHGEWDRAVSGGVPVEQSRQMAKLLKEKGYPHTYTEVPKTGHGCRVPEVWQAVISWLLDQRKQRKPQHVSLATYSLRHNRAYWLKLEQLASYGEKGMVEAALEAEALVVTTKNVRAISVGPITYRGSLCVQIDGQDLGPMDLGARHTFQRDAADGWKTVTAMLSGQKRHAVSGPISDLFHEGLLLVSGTAGSDEQTFFNQWILDNARGYFSNRNGGVHRGGIMGHNAVNLPSVTDAALDELRLVNNNLLLYGNFASNSVLARFKEYLPLRFAEDRIELAGKTYQEKGVAVFATFPHPLNPKRYLAVHGGTRPDAVCWGSHLDMQLLPDYLVYAGGQTLDWGFWDNEWK